MRIGRNDRNPGIARARAEQGKDTRTPSQVDRDRILYSSAFRRLAGVTQVAGAGEGHVFHNRLTHTLEVAQIARRLAERFVLQHGPDLANCGEVIDPDVVEAAALAHDLGHPPFGHIAEEELRRLVTARSPEADGFEGNAQSLRIVTRLATHRNGYRGLNLTRATLNAILKYPWFRGHGPPGGDPKKFGAYGSEREDFTRARSGYQEHEKSLEAAIMDHADAVAYSVHDLDDFYRARLVPLELISDTRTEDISAFRASLKPPAVLTTADEETLGEIVDILPRGQRFSGDYKQRGRLKAMTSRLITRFIDATTLEFENDRVTFHVAPKQRLQMKFLQNLVWRYVIESPRLTSQQHGQRRIIRELFEAYHDASTDKDGARIIPAAFHEDLRLLDQDTPGLPTREARAARLAADIVSSFTDAQAGVVHRRLTGVSSGSVSDLLD